MADWAAIRAEYIAGGTSFRKLAEKHGVSFNTVKGRARRERWTEGRRKACEIAATKAIEMTATAVAEFDRRIYATADRLLDRVSEAITQIDSADTGSMRQVAAILRDLQDIKGMRSELVRRETEARIAKLRREAEREDEGDRVVEIRLSSELEEYSK